MSAAQTSRRLLELNHAGECGAVRIYRAQLAVAPWRCPDLIPFLRETLGHEQAHVLAFARLLAERSLGGSRAMGLWTAGGWALGLITGLLGREAVLICTEAVEQTVQRHLEEQLEQLGDSDPDLSATIQTIRDEELGHLAHAAAARRGACPAGSLLALLVRGLTEALILTFSPSDREQRPLQPCDRSTAHVAVG